MHRGAKSAASSQASLQPAFADRRLEGKPGIPGKIDPGILRYFGDEGVDQRAAHGLGVNRGKMSLGEKVAHEPRSVAGIDQVVDDQNALAAPAFRGRKPNALEQAHVASIGMFVARDAYGIDHAKPELARDNRGRYESAARDRNDRIERPGSGEPPGKRARVAVELLPRDWKYFLRLTGAHRRSSTKSNRAAIAFSTFAIVSSSARR